MKLINKAAVVAAIESLRCTSYTNFDEGVNATVQTLLETLNTLEVREVDFEKIWKEYFKYSGDVATVNVKHLAKHFFELGIQQSNKE